MTAPLQSASAWLNRVCWHVAAILTVCMVVTVLLQVVARYIFASPPSWTEELARYFMVWSGLLGATVTYYEREDPVLLAVPEFRARWREVGAEIVRSAAVLAFVIPLLVYSPRVIGHHMLRLTESMGITSAYVLVVVPIFSAIILFHLLVRVAALFSTAPADRHS